MIAHLVLTSFGLFLLDEKGKVISKQVAYPDVETISSDFTHLGEGQPTERLENLAKELARLGVESVVVENGMISRALTGLTQVPVSVNETSAVFKTFRDTQDSYLLKSGLLKEKEDIASFRRDVAIHISRTAITAASEEKDLLVKHAIDAIGEVDRSINILAMRLREWYSLHHPSLNDLVDDHEIFANVVSSCGGRSEIKAECLSEAGCSDQQAQSVMNAMLRDLGAPFETTDLSVAQSLANTVQILYAKRREVEEYVGQMMDSVAPNITALVGPLVGARLISLAGSLKDLAKKPSSTVQIYGAEKALFRSLKTGTDPPKHGIIYQVPEVHSAPYWQRGKIARALAGKISIAARIDAYSKRNIGTELKKKFLERVSEIQKQNVEEPPPKPVKKFTKKPSKRGRAHGHQKRKRGGKKQ
ncbi:MAG: C/D box methylation guide ribonucleoprotein complex aNOP56 subunit [Candidatus Thorarchaeota archaeon]